MVDPIKTRRADPERQFGCASESRPKAIEFREDNMTAISQLLSLGKKIPPVRYEPERRDIVLECSHAEKEIVLDTLRNVQDEFARTIRAIGSLLSCQNPDPMLGGLDAEDLRYVGYLFEGLGSVTANISIVAERIEDAPAVEVGDRLRFYPVGDRRA